ncbi:LysE family transporter [Streptomyces violascens]|uniref:LysE family transporter n=1 Tax=Streptomyces violascens TaxID=67381 RepID=UPI0036CEB889
MNGLWTTAMAGAAAGLGVAVPVGAVGVLLIQEGMRERRGAMAAAAAVATVDLVYAALATALGPLVAEALSGVEAWVRLVSALVLAAIAGRGLWGSRGAGGEAGEVREVTPSGPAASAVHAGPVAPTGPGAQAPPSEKARPARNDGPARAFARFAALTLVNPTTALYFAALTTARGASLTGGAAGAVFVTGVFLASLLWQQFLVAASRFAGARISPAARAWTFRAGYGLVAPPSSRLRSNRGDPHRGEGRDPPALRERPAPAERGDPYGRMRIMRPDGAA